MRACSQFCVFFFFPSLSCPLTYWHPLVSQTHLNGWVFSLFLDFPPFQLSTSLAQALGMQPEWRPRVWSGPVVHISHFCKPCHWPLQVTGGSPAFCLFSAHSFLAELCRRNAGTRWGGHSRRKQTRAKG